jgi:light-regulated signal transduction histidine kinase (bacteriophytochrome)
MAWCGPRCTAVVAAAIWVMSFQTGRRCGRRGRLTGGVGITRNQRNNPPGQVTVEVKEGGNAIISVADDGPGIPAEEYQRVLKRFYRLEQSRRAPGNGLGLNLVAAVARLHGARIEMADNSPGLKIALRFHSPSKSDLEDGGLPTPLLS